ncbi:MAG: histidine phosphatase family protein [Nitrospirae bacterium]|nr:histidine phosphatase family protein [Nitrospirota bacterium]MBI3378646.1 histidine phosphatase family protein [Nitrospirota bacterium]
MVTTLYLIRHGATEGSETKRYKGSIDVPMSEKGIEQIKGTSVFIQNMIQDKKNHESCILHSASSKLSAVYCSPLSRALKSAEIIAEPYDLKPIAIEDLRERSFGIWEGMTFTEIKENYPQEFEAWAGNPLTYSPVDGESTVEVRERTVKAVDSLLSNHNSEHIAIVAHGGVNRIILCHIMGIPLENIFRIEQDFAAVNIIEFWEKYPVVKLLNGAACG